MEIIKKRQENRKTVIVGIPTFFKQNFLPCNSNTECVSGIASAMYTRSQNYTFLQVWIIYMIWITFPCNKWF